MSKRLEPGAKVKWESQSGGYWTEKKGFIVCYLPPNADPFELYPPLKEAKRSHIKFDRFSQNARYLVAVPRGGKSTVTDYYAPQASRLER